jgi:hypothetical protein
VNKPGISSNPYRSQLSSNILLITFILDLAGRDVNEKLLKIPSVPVENIQPIIGADKKMAPGDVSRIDLILLLLIEPGRPGSWENIW